jgi:DNA-binding MarR family transcriptional regulator
MNKRPPRHARRAPTGEPLVFALLGAAGSVEARLEAALTPLGLSLAKVALLEHLAQAKEPLPLSQLATHQHCVRSNITQLVDRLEKDGLVRRRPDQDDRRSIRAALTPAGVRAHAQGVRALADAQREIMSALSAKDAASLKSALATLES